MVLEQRDEVLLDIYSIDYLLKCSVLDLNQQILLLSPVSGKIDIFLKHDPVVLIKHDAGNITVTSGEVADIDRSARCVAMKIRDEEIPEERRVFERYPASLMVSARKKYSNKRMYMRVRNISMYGMGAISEVELDEGECVDIDLITERSMLYFSGKVIWREQMGDVFEYGFQLTHCDVATRYLLQEYLNKQKFNYLNMIPKAK